MNHTVQKAVECCTLAVITIICCVLAVSCADKGADSNHPLLAKCRNMYKQASIAQNNGEYDKAKTIYDRLLHTTTTDPVINDSLLPIASKAITQVMNTMQSQGNVKECVEYLQKLEREKNIICGQLCRRDIKVTLAYAMSRTDNEREAAVIMDSALNIKPYKPTPNRMFRDYAYATAVYFCLPERKDDVNKYGTLALKEIAKSDNKAGESWITAILGMSYIRTGELGNAINMFKESYNNAQIRHDTLSMANTLNLMANIMINWNLYDYANDYSSQAVMMSESIKNRNPKICSNILSNKALIMEKFGYTDSASMYLEQAYQYTKDLPYNSGNSDIDLIRGELLTKQDRTRGEGLKILYKAVNNATSGIRTKALFQIAQDHIAHGEFAAGEKALDSTIQTMSINTSPILINNIYEYALNHYVSTDNRDKIVKLAKSLEQNNRQMSTSDVMKQTAESIVEFKTRERTEELNWQQLQLEQKKKFIAIYTVVILLLLIGVTVTLLVKRRYAVLRQQYAERQLENLSYRMEMMQQTKQQADIQIDLSQSNLQNKEGEDRFRSKFMQIHPYFIGNLRNAVPGISRREEMLAMLIALKIDSSQIENIMCIARSSINMARYRLRMKMGLSRDKSLEDAIYEILKK